MEGLPHATHRTLHTPITVTNSHTRVIMKFGETVNSSLLTKLLLPAQLKLGEAEVENLFGGNCLDLLGLEGRDGILQD